MFEGHTYRKIRLLPVFSGGQGMRIFHDATNFVRIFDFTISS